MSHNLSAKGIVVTIAFVLVTVPGFLEDLLSLRDRLSGPTGGSVNVSVGDWYQLIFPPLGLAILLFGIWWIPRVSKNEPSQQASQNSEVQGPDTMPEPRAVNSTVEEPEDHESHVNPVLGLPMYKTGKESAPVILETSASILMGLFSGRSSIEAKHLIEHYIGSLLLLKGEIQDIDETHSGRYRLSLKEISSGARIYCYFDEEWEQGITKLKLGQVVSVLGSLTNVDSLSVRLEHSSLSTQIHVQG